MNLSIGNTGNITSAGAVHFKHMEILEMPVQTA
jgi:hypothetical protein